MLTHLFERRENKVSPDCLIPRSALQFYSHAPSKSDYDTLVLVFRKNWYVLSFLFFSDGSTVQFEVFLFFFFYFCIRCQDQICRHEYELCRRNEERVHLIAVSLAATDRVTASCQGNGSRSHLHRCSNTINIRIVEEGKREMWASSSFFFVLSLSLFEFGLNQLH